MSWNDFGIPWSSPPSGQRHHHGLRSWCGSGCIPSCHAVLRGLLGAKGRSDRRWRNLLLRLCLAEHRAFVLTQHTFFPKEFGVGVLNAFKCPPQSGVCRGVSAFPQLLVATLCICLPVWPVWASVWQIPQSNSLSSTPSLGYCVRLLTKALPSNCHFFEMQIYGGQLFEVYGSIRWCNFWAVERYR